MVDLEKRTDFLIDGAKEFCQSVGIHNNILEKIYNAESDWQFIIQLDALLETATREIVSRFLKIEIAGGRHGLEAADKFVQGLPLNGRSSLLQLLRASKAPPEMCDFIETCRIIRNSFVHDIRKVDNDLFSGVTERSDRSLHLRRLIQTNKFTETEWLDAFRERPEVFRYVFFDGALRFLTLGYYVVMKN